MPEEFSVQEENISSVVDHCKNCNAIQLCIISPFTPLRLSPGRSITPSFSFPDEFAIESFVEKVVQKYPEKKERPPLHLTIHSPGGSVSTSYVTSKVLRDTFNEIVAFVPHIAASGATILALSCNKLVFGSISRLTGINPIYYFEDGIMSPLSMIRSFDKLEEELATKDEKDISYPKKHLLETITAEELDDANHTMGLVEQYARELMDTSGYSQEKIETILQNLLYDVDAHEQVFLLDNVKKIGINAIHYKDDAYYNECWVTSRKWLFNYYLQPSPTHLIKYRFSSSNKKEGKEGKKENEKNIK